MNNSKIASELLKLAKLLSASPDKDASEYLLRIAEGLEEDAKTNLDNLKTDLQKLASLKGKISLDIKKDIIEVGKLFEKVVAITGIMKARINKNNEDVKGQDLDRQIEEERRDRFHF